MQQLARYVGCSAVFFFAALAPAALAQSAQLKRGSELFDRQEYVAAQEALQKVDRPALSEVEQRQLDGLLKVLPEAVAGARRAEQDLAAGDRAFAAGRWDEAEKAYAAVSANRFAKPALQTGAAEQVQACARKRAEEKAARRQKEKDETVLLSAQDYTIKDLGSGQVSSGSNEAAVQVQHSTTPTMTQVVTDGGTRATVVDEMSRRDALLWERAVAKMNEAIGRGRDAMAKGDFEQARREAEAALNAVDSARAYAEPASKYEDAHQIAVNFRQEVEDGYRSWEETRSDAAREEIKRRMEQKRQIYEQQRAEKIEQLFNTASQLRQEQRYSEAAQVLREILYIDPANARAKAQLEVMEDLLSLQGQAALETDYRRQSLNALATAEETKVPWDYEVLYPKNWLQITAKRGGAAVGVVGATDEDTELNKALREELPDVQFDDTPLETVMEFLQDAQKVNISVDWDDLQSAGVERDTPISVRLAKLSFGTVLREIINQAGGADSTLSYRVVDGLVRVATREKLDHDKYALVYDVRDLLVAIPRFLNAPQINADEMVQRTLSATLLTPNEPGFFESAGVNDDLSGRGGRSHPGLSDPAMVTQLLDLIRTTVAPDSWKETGLGDGSLRELNGNLVVYNTSDAHKQVSDLLGQLRATRALQVSIETRFLSLSNNYLEQIGVDLDFVLNQGSADFDRAFTPGGAGIFDPFTGAPVLVPRPFSQIGSFATPPPFGTPFVPSPVAIGQPYSHAAFVPMGTGVIPQFNDMTPIPVQQNSSSLGDVTSFNTGVPGSWANRVSQDPALSIQGSFLDNLQVDFLIRATQANSRSSLVQAPRIMMFNGQRANISVGRNQQYVSSVRPVVAEGVATNQPIIANAFSGTTLDVEATISADRRYVTVTVRAGQAKDPQFTRFEVQRASGDSPGVFIMLLDQSTANINTTVSVPDGGTVLLGGVKLAGDVEVDAGVPVLSKIPILKRAFTNTSSIKDVSNLLMLMKAKIVIQKEAEEEAFPTMLNEAG